MISIPIQFYAGETFAPPAFLWRYSLYGCWTPINITGFRSAFTVRQYVGDPNPPLISATTENGKEFIDGPAGAIQLILPASFTSTLDVPFDGVWDQWAYSPQGIAYRLVGGTIIINEAVTR